MPDRTKREIVAAFNRLIARSDMEKITTLRIAEEAEVSKATFYRYFRDKYDVLNYNYQSLLDRSLKQCGNYRDLYVLLYSFARDQWQNFTRAFNTTGINSFDNFIYSYSRDVVEESRNRTERRRPDPGGDAAAGCVLLRHLLHVQEMDSGAVRSGAGCGSGRSLRHHAGESEASVV